MISRKSVDLGAEKRPLQSVEFGYFRKKNKDGGGLGLRTIDGKQNQFHINKTANCLVNIILTSVFLNQNRPRKIKNQKQRIFSGFVLENAPRSYFNYQHERTLEELWHIIKNKSNTLEQITHLLNDYPICEFVMQCYARKMIKDYLEETLDLDLHGNEEEVLLDYQQEIRGPLLHFLAEIMKLQILIMHENSEKGEEKFEESLGDSSSHWKVHAYDEGEMYRFQIVEEDEHPKLSSINSFTNIKSSAYNRRKSNNNTESERGETTADGHSLHRMQIQSKSANKDQTYKCRGCGSKVRFCQCEQKRKGATPRQGNQPMTPVRSIFDGMGFDRLGGRRSREAVSDKICHNCSRLACICKK